MFMVRATLLLAAAGLSAACSPSAEPDAKNSVAARAPVAAAPVPATSLTPTSATPARPAALIAEEERENEACRGGSGDDIATMRACNRRQVVMKKLQDSGWCWGGADIEADKRFIPCKPGDRDYSPGAFDKPYYSDEEIAELTGNSQ